MSHTMQDRMRNMRNAIHSVEMEGGDVDQETQEHMAAYARGEVSAEQLSSTHCRLSPPCDD